MASVQRQPGSGPHAELALSVAAHLFASEKHFEPADAPFFFFFSSNISLHFSHARERFEFYRENNLFLSSFFNFFMDL